MSYAITVKVVGSTAVVTTSGDVPDGEHVITGHEDSGQRTLTVTRRHPDGRYAGQATAVHHKEA